MPYTDDLDETTPADTEGVSQGDDRIREVKRALNERMADLVNNWPDGPLTLKGTALEAGGATAGISETMFKDSAADLITLTKHVAITGINPTVNAGDYIDFGGALNFPGAKVGDFVGVGHPAAIPAAAKAIVAFGYCDLDGEVKLRLLNLTGSNITYGVAVDYKLWISKPISEWS